MTDDGTLSAAHQGATSQEWSSSEVCREVSTGDGIDRLFNVFERIGKVFTQLREHLGLN